MSNIVRLYVKWVQNPTKDFTIDDVPQKWRADVEKALEEQTV